MSTHSNPTAKPGAKRSLGLMRSFRRQARALTPFITLIVMVLFFALASEGNRFINPDNMRNILIQAASLAILATGVTFVLLIGEIDLSVGGIATAAAVVSCYMFVTLRFDGWICVLTGTVLGAVLGLINGVVIARVGVPSFMVTLAMQFITNGISLFLTKGRPIFDVPEISLALGTGEIGPVPAIVIVAAIVMILGTLLLVYTRFGRYVYMAGGNKEAAELSGVNAKNITIAVMMISGLLAGFSGIVGSGRLGSANPDIFKETTLDVIATVVLGGTSLFGGVGSVPNTVIGLLVFGVLKNGLNLVNIDIYIKPFITGVILLLALILNVFALRLGQSEQEAEIKDVTKKEEAPPVGSS